MRLQPVTQAALIAAYVTLRDDCESLRSMLYDDSLDVYPNLDSSHQWVETLEDLVDKLGLIRTQPDGQPIELSESAAGSGIR